MHREDDTKWPQKNKDGRQELEIRLGNEHISFEVGTPLSINPVLVTWSGADPPTSLPDCEDRIARGCDRLGGPRRTSSVLLPGAGSQGLGLLTHLSAFQGRNKELACNRTMGSSGTR